ncbi:MAG: hypothetical protein ACOC85_03580 [Thermoplasmatota archaeon]
MDPCLFNLLLPGFVLIVPYKLFKEKNITILAVVGIVILLLLGITFTAYQVEGIYIGRKPDELSSEYLSEGKIDKVHGNIEESFSFSVIVTDEAYDEIIHDNNYSVNLNLMHYVDEEDEKVDDYELVYQEVVPDKGHKYSIEINNLEEALYSHNFTLRIEMDEGFYEESTNEGYGPFTIGRAALYQVIMTQQISSTILIFFIYLAFLWWKMGALEKAKKKYEREIKDKSKNKADDTD